MRNRRPIVNLIIAVTICAALFGASCARRGSDAAQERRIGPDQLLTRDPMAVPAPPRIGAHDALADRADRDGDRDRDRDDDPDRVGLDGRPLPGTDYPGEAVRFRNLTLRDEHGNIPLDGPVNAYAHVQRMLAAGAAQQLRHLENSVGISRSTWSWLGPGNIGGRIRSIAIHPLTPTTMFAGSVGGGIWRTADGGASWAPVDDFIPNLAVSSIVIDQGAPAIMYAGTGEGFYNGDGLLGAGVFKSTDGGVSWSQLAATNTSSFNYVNRLAIAPNSSVLLAATRSGMFRSVDGGASFATASISGIGSGITDVAFNPVDSTKAVASGYDGDAWYSIDAGATWIAAAGLPGGSFRRVEIAYAPSLPSTVYASVDQNGGTIYVSTNGGVSYSLVSNPSQHYLGSQGWYDNALWVNPIDSTAIIVGGIDLFRSTNGGATISRISAWQYAPLSDHADHHVIVSPPGFDNAANSTIFSGDDGGVYRAANWSTVGGGGASDCSTVSPFNCEAGWTSLNHNLGVTQFYGGAGFAGTGRILGGTQDNGTLLYNGSAQAWTSEFGGDGGFAAIDPTNPSVLYGEYVYLALHRSLTGSAAGADYIYGAGYNGSSYGCKAAPYYIPDVCSGGGILGQANFIAPFILDPNVPTRLLAGGVSLWRTNDATTPNTATTGPSWASIKGPNSVASPISAIAVAGGNSDIIWVGHDNGDVFKTTNGTAVSPIWTQVDNGSTPLPNRYVTRLTIDPANPNIVYAAFGGYSSDNLYRTGDGGATWTAIAGSGPTALPAAPVRDLKVLPTNTAWIYAGTDAGVFASGDGGVTWGPPTVGPTDGPANVAIDELFFLDNQTLVAVTHGRGMFKTTITFSGGGHIAGTVTDAVATPLANVTVKVFNDVGTFLTSATTDASGNYSSSDLGTGTYYAVASNASGYLDQVYGGGDCLVCTPTAGTPIGVTAPSTTPNINFALSVGGQIAGRVSSAGSGLANVTVQVFNATGGFVTSSATDVSGNYMSSGLPGGTYYARTSNSAGYIDQLYNAIACAACTVTAGTPIPVSVASVTAGVNFALVQGGQIAGTVTVAGTATKLANVVVQVYNSSGTLVTATASDVSGNYAARGLPTATYYARSANTIGYGDRLYNDLPCGVGCNPAAGTPIAVTAPSITPTINFALTPPAPVQLVGPNFGTFSIGVIQFGLLAGGGNGTFTWSIVGGALPPGLSIRTDPLFGVSSNASAAIAGVATTAGVYSFTLRVSSAGVNTDQACTLKVTGLTIRDGSHFGELPQATLGAAYAYQLAALNAAGTPVFFASNIPPGLSLSSSGLLSGTPQATGGYSITFHVFDGTDTATRSLSLGIDAFSITNAGVLPNAVRGQAYSTTLALSGGTGPSTFFSGCCLPIGLSLSSSGVISGTVSTSASQGPTAFTVFVNDAASHSMTKRFSIDVVGTPVAPPGLSPYSSIDDCTIGVVCSRGIAIVSGGTAVFSVSATGLPPGMAIRSASGRSGAIVSGGPGYGYSMAAGDAEIYGTPTALGTFNVRVTATDALGTVVAQEYPFRVSALEQPYAVDGGTVNVPVNTSFGLLGGTLPYSGTVVSGALPAGLTVQPGSPTLTGTPLESGFFKVVINFTDAASHSLLVTENIGVGSATFPGISISSASDLGTAFATSFYSTQLLACCASTYTWSFVSGALPPGLAIAPTGLFSGTPSTPGLYTFVLRAADGSNSANYGQRQFTLRVLPVGVGPLFVLTSSLPSGRVSATYPQTSLQSSGGTGPVTWKLAFNSYLPPGVTLGPNGVLSGVPTGSGQFSFTVIATDAGGQTASRSLSIAVSPAPPRRAGSDFNGDGKSDAGIFRPSVMPDALWYSTPTGGGSPFQIFFGASGDVPVVGDYDGDGRADAVIWRPSTGLWYGPRTGAAQIAIQLVLGQMGDIPVPCDYNGDGAIDPAYYRPSTGQWFGTTANGSTVVLNTNLGLVAGDIPAPADYDGDGKCDPGIMRPGVGPGGTNLWYSVLSGGGAPFQIYFGAVGDIPVPGDYDGDGKADAVIFRPSMGLWYGPRTGAAQIVTQIFLGQSGDIPIPGDYDGDGAVDPAIYRPSTGLFYGTNALGSVVVLNTNLGVTAGDLPTGQRPH